MIDLRLGRYALGATAIVAMLAGCGGTQPPMGAPNALDPPRKHHRQKQSQTFSFTGSEQTFTVPAGVKQIRVIALGGSGGGGMGARGGRVSAVIPADPGESLAVYVGGGTDGQLGGFNGGGKGGYSSWEVRGIHSHGHGGGGASDVRENGDSLADRVLVAGGGGGQGGFDCGNRCQTYGLSGAGGAGGGTTGGGGQGGGGGVYGAGGGGGGTQSAGGAGGKGGDSGSGYSGIGHAGRAGHGGHGGYGCLHHQHGYCGEGGGGGGGGGGYNGGGGGGAGASIERTYVGGGGGGGGGSSYAERRATDVHMWQGWKNPDRNGLVVFSW